MKAILYLLALAVLQSSFLLSYAFYEDHSHPQREEERISSAELTSLSPADMTADLSSLSGKLIYS